MSALTDIYDFESVVESAVKAVLVANEITAYTTQDFTPTNPDGTPNQDFQLKRPRVEIMFIPGAAAGVWVLVNGQPRDSAFKGTIQLRVITEPHIAVHSAFRATVRGLMHGIGLAVNGTAPMTRHKIQPWFRDGGTSVMVKTEDGYLRTDLSFEIDFTIQYDAWQALQT